MNTKKILHSFSIIYTIVLGITPFTANAQSAHQLLRKGDDQYTKSKYSDAEKSYSDALKKSGKDDKAAYNLGNTYYRQGDYPNAARMLEDAAKTAKTPGERADAYHNLGNANLKQEKYKEAVDAYQKSLMNRPGDPGTKTNLQMAKQKLQQQQQQQNQQQQDQQQQQNQQNNQQQNQQSQNQNQQDQQQNKDQQNQQQQQQNQQQNKESQGQNQNQQQQQNQEIPKLNQPSEQFLEAIGREDRRNKREYQEKTNNRKPSTRRKDWK